jgi:hypothetical protein
MKFEKYGNEVKEPKVTMGPLDFARSDVFWTLTILLRKIRNEKPDIYQAFKEKVSNLILVEIGEENFRDQVEKVNRHLVEYENLVEESEFVRLHLSFMIQTLKITPEKLWENKTTAFPTKNFMPSSFGLFYLQVKALIELLGREKGLKFFREFQDTFNAEVNALYQKDRYESLEHVRSELVDWLPRNPYGRNKILSEVKDGRLIELCINCEKYNAMKESKYGYDAEILYHIMCYMHKPLIAVWNDNFRLELDRSLALKNKFCSYIFYDKRETKKFEPLKDEFLEEVWKKYK